MADSIRRIDLGVNCYLVAVERGFVLIDAGFPRTQAQLDKALSAAGCTPGNLRLVVATHGDIDHIGACAHLREVYGAPVAVQRDDAEILRTGDMSLGRKNKAAGMAVVFRLAVWVVGLLNKLRGPHAMFQTLEPDVLLEDGQDLSAYGFDARVVSLPGHSNGSIGILTADGDVFCGDLLMNLRRPSLHFYVDDRAQALASVAKLRDLGVKTVYPGHGKPFELEQLSL